MANLQLLRLAQAKARSSLCRMLATELLKKGEKVGYIALEESNRRTALGLMSVAVGKALHLGEHEYSTLKDAYDKTILELEPLFIRPFWQFICGYYLQPY
ncbi:MAG: hypothetical protein CM15mP103_08490 [Gammaproteobacteria bacterium]|nr:MAG: hypothetical protein CM15mP103_08490 [Gammaproteobacteria bacterium]